MNKKLHVISFDIPCPPNYGGIIDVYYKIKSLHEAGAEIIIHCFEYGRERNDELEKICKKVYYYPRKKTWIKQFSFLPFIVKTRNNPDLLINLLADPAPILFEGLHTCYLLDHPKLKDYKKLVRTHNIEHEYYYFLWKSEKNLTRKSYFLLESVKLKPFEKKLSRASQILAISPQDTKYFNTKYGNTTLMPAFHPFKKVSSISGQGEYVLFHGNLSVAENLNAITFLIDKVFSEMTIPLILAGQNPPNWLISKIKDIPHVQIEASPSIEKMNKLIHEAQICLIPTFQPTGLKLKLLSSLFAGRHCITNHEMVNGTGIEELCHVAQTPEEMINFINHFINVEFTIDDISKRKSCLKKQFSNEQNAQTIMDLI